MRASLAAVLALVVAACVPSVAHAADYTFQRDLTVNGDVTLNVCSGSGDIHVSGTGGNTVHIYGKIPTNTWHSWHLFGPSTDEMKRIVANPPIQQNGNIIHIGNHETCEGHMFRDISIDYEITAPKNAIVVADTGSGDIRIESISGSLHADTGSGDIRANGIGSGSTLETGSGTIDVQQAQGTIKASTGSGNVKIQNSQIQDARASTGSGDIVIGDVHGSLSAGTGSGNITAIGMPSSNWKLDAGSGSIQFNADPNAKFNLDAESDSGSIHSKLAVSVTGDLEHGELRGPVNGGGPVVKIRTGSGDITLR